jgi:hypothetical protein
MMATTATFAQQGKMFFGGDLNFSLNGGETQTNTIIGNVQNRCTRYYKLWY